MTADALNHRFRRIRAEATIIKAARQQDLDMKNLKLGDELPTVQGAVDMDSTSVHSPIPVMHSHTPARSSVPKPFAMLAPSSIQSPKTTVLTFAPIHRHCQVLWPIHRRWHPISVPCYQVRRQAHQGCRPQRPRRCRPTSPRPQRPRGHIQRHQHAVQDHAVQGHPKPCQGHQAQAGQHQGGVCLLRHGRCR